MNDENFLAYIHMHTIGYRFGPYKILPEDNGLWYVEDKFGYRMNADGLFIGPPANHHDRPAWIIDTVHAFVDAYRMLREHCDPSILALPKPS